MLRRSKDIASVVAFGSPVNPGRVAHGHPGEHGRAVADFMADHVFNRLDIPSWMARMGFQMMDPQNREGPGTSCVGCTTARLLPREQQRRFLESERMDRLVGPGDLGTAQVHRTLFRMMTGGFAISDQMW